MLTFSSALFFISVDFLFYQKHTDDHHREHRAVCGYPSSVNRGYFSYGGLESMPATRGVSIHPLSIEAISPTVTIQGAVRENSEYPSSVNRGYFSY